MSKSKQNPKKTDKKAANSFVWTDDEVEKFTCTQAIRLEISPRRRETRFTRCAAILVYCAVRDWGRFCTSSDSKIFGFHRPHVIGFVANLFFSALECGFKNNRIRCRIRRMRVDGSRIRKEKFADSKISGYVWTGPERNTTCPWIRCLPFTFIACMKYCYSPLDCYLFMYTSWWTRDRHPVEQSSLFKEAARRLQSWQSILGLISSLLFLLKQKLK